MTSLNTVERTTKMEYKLQVAMPEIPRRHGVAIKFIFVPRSIDSTFRNVLFVVHVGRYKKKRRRRRRRKITTQQKFTENNSFDSIQSDQFAIFIDIFFYNFHTYTFKTRKIRWKENETFGCNSQRLFLFALNRYKGIINFTTLFYAP